MSPNYRIQNYKCDWLKSEDNLRINSAFSVILNRMYRELKDKKMQTS